jgi:hypothetical protein
MEEEMKEGGLTAAIGVALYGSIGVEMKRWWENWCWWRNCAADDVTATFIE